MDYNSDLLSNLGRQATIFLKHDFKTRVGMFIIMGGNIPGGTLLGGNFPDGNFPRDGGGRFMGGDFSGGSFPDTIFSCQLLSLLFLFIILSFALNSIFLLQILSSVTFTYFFSVRVKPIQNVIVKNEKYPWLEILL